MTQKVLSTAEREKQLLEWNDTQADFPDDLCIHQFVETQVERTPDVVAVVYGDQQLTYRELNQRANRVANYLRRLDVGPEVLVGLCVERSIDQVVGLLGILKAGGAYVPLDPAYPKKRLAFMLQDAGISILLTQHRLVERLPTHDATLVCLDTDWTLIAEESDLDMAIAMSPANLAYVIYTSGSTGRPKGVAMSHAPICNLIWWQINNSPLPHGVKTLQFASLSFDVSVQEIFSTLCGGGTLVLISEEQRHDISALPRVLVALNVERIFLPAAVLQQLAGAALQDGIYPAKLHEIITAGEQLRITSDITGWLTRLGDCILQNQYGPTETHVVVTSYVMGGTPTEWSSLPPIGKPISNTTIYILDAELQPVPVGDTGELYIGGICLAHGYLKRPELTAEKFIPNPFNADQHSRLYKTGDQARYLPDGNIEFIGRIDHQVKIRGFRVEQGEVEAQLNQHPAVRQTVVLAREDEPGEKLLVAYIVPEGMKEVTVSELRSFLLEILPDYMVPTQYVKLDALPLTPNGKVDRDALPVPNQNRLLPGNIFEVPRNTKEQAIADVWANVLGVEHVGIHDDFFDLGGDSLKVTRVLVRLDKLFGRRLLYQTFFEGATVATIARCIDDSEAELACQELPAISSYPRGRMLPLSFGQEEIWFSLQLKPDAAVYNEIFTIDIGEHVDRHVFEKAFNELIRRHEILRTAFINENGQPVQVIKENINLKLLFVDLLTVSVEDRLAKALQRATHEARRPFDLAEPPLLRAILARFDESEHRLYMIIHHIVIDAVGFYNVMVPELWTLYSAYCEGKSSPLKPLAIQYADFAQWQRKWLQGTVLEKNLTYWKKHLDGLAGLDLPTDKRRPSVRSFSGEFVTLTISRELTEKLYALARRNGATMYMLLLAAFNVLLWRYTQQDEIVVGTVDAGRSHPELEGQLGYLLNTLIIRTSIQDDSSFLELLQHIRQVTLQAFVHKDCPFVKLVEQLQPDRDPARHPIYQVAFVMEPAMPAYEWGWTVSQLEVQNGNSKFDLTLELEERSEGIIGRFEYANDLFEVATIERLIGHFQTLLTGIVAEPGQQISELPLLTAAEREQLVVDWNRTERDYPRDKSLAELFEAQVDRDPDAVALVYGEQQLTYGELNARANRLAHYLRRKGVGLEKQVGVCLERSAEMVVGVLGVLKAGGAYVPLDPTYPRTRLAFMVGDAGLGLVLTQTSLQEELPTGAAQVVVLDSEWEAISQESTENPVAGVNGEHLAYVIYTSGSTGQPKGVAVPQRGVLRLVCNIDYVRLDASQTFLMLAPISFDASTFELWGALLHGARCIIFPERVSGLRDLGVVIEREKISVLWLTASLFNTIIDESPEILKGVSQLLTGGEALSVAHVRRAQEVLSETQIINGYGPTESTTFTCCYPISSVLPEQCNGIPIGQPIANTQVYILDKKLNLLPVGAPGELHIGGDGLARGYLNRPELTAEKFIPSPFSDNPKARLYKTGDLARYLPDGNIEFLGRMDNQVKVRGFRIEPGEIEAVLEQHPAVHRSVVLAREDVPGDRRLVSYVVPVVGHAPSLYELRVYLKASLPDYMVPAAFVLLDKLPLTPNGKIDRKALPAPEHERLELGEEITEPCTVTEQALVKIWVDILGLDRVGIHDNFFVLGGHSLLATRVVSRIRDVFKYELPLRLLFELPTIAGLARVLDQQHSQLGGEVPAIKPTSREPHRR